MKANHKIKKMVVYLILKGGVLSFTTTHPEAFHYYHDYWVNNDGVIKWHNGQSHKKNMAQKASRKKELMRVAWHPSRWWDWCASEDGKRETEKFFERSIKSNPCLSLGA